MTNAKFFEIFDDDALIITHISKLVLKPTNVFYFHKRTITPFTVSN